MEEPELKSMISSLIVVGLLVVCVMGIIATATLYDKLIFIQQKILFAMGFFFCGFVVGYSGSILFGIKE